MAIDVIGGVGMVGENEKIPFPEPTPIHAVSTDTPEAIVTLALVDFEVYPRKGRVKFLGFASSCN